MPGVSAPFAVGSQLTITRGQMLQFSASDLTPRSLIPYEVNAIRMCAYPSIETAPANIGSSTALKGFLKWQFVLGRLPLTDGYVPMWNLMPVRQQITEDGGYYEWRFKRPMLVPAGGRVDARVQLQSTTPNPGTTPITVAVALVGNFRGDVEHFPSMIDVPFASCWDTTDPNENGLANETRLGNPLVRAIDVEMLIGRVQSDETGLEGDDSKTLQIFDPYGRSLHRSGPIQMHALFPPTTRSIPYVGQIPAQNGHFHVRLDTAPSVTYRPMISYLGSRREPLL